MHIGKAHTAYPPPSPVHRVPFTVQYLLSWTNGNKFISITSMLGNPKFWITLQNLNKA